MKQFNITEFEFSQSYLFFWDKVCWDSCHWLFLPTEFDLTSLGRTSVAGYVIEDSCEWLCRSCSLGT